MQVNNGPVFGEHYIPPVDELVRIDLQQTRYDLKAEFYEPFTDIESLKFVLLIMIINMLSWKMVSLLEHNLIIKD